MVTTWTRNSINNISFLLKLNMIFVTTKHCKLNLTFSLKHLFNFRIKLLVRWSPLSPRCSRRFKQTFLRSSTVCFFFLLMLEFNLFSKELRTSLGYEFQDIGFLMVLICSLNAALVLHVILARWNKTFTYAVFMSHCV